MGRYNEKKELYFELKGLPDSSRESYSRRMKASLTYMESQDKPIENTNEEAIQQYILYLKMNAVCPEEQSIIIFHPFIFFIHLY